MAKKKLSKEARNQLIIELTKAGVSQAEIQKETKCSRTTIQNVLRALRANSDHVKGPVVAAHIVSQIDPNVGDEELKRHARRDLVACAGRLASIIASVDSRIRAEFEPDAQLATNKLRDLTWVRGVLQDKYVGAIDAAIRVGPAVPAPPATADFTPDEIVDTPAPPGAPDDAPID